MQILTCRFRSVFPVPFFLLFLLYSLPAVAQHGAVAVVMTRGTGYTDQYWAATADPPGRTIQLLKANDMAVTTLAGINGSWIVVGSRGTPYTDQVIDGVQNDVRRLPVRDRWNSGYYVTSLAYSSGIWGSVASQQSGYTGQVFLGGAVFPAADVEKARTQGYAITSLAYSDSGWVIVVSQGTNYSAQTVLRGAQFPRADVDGKMREGFAITDLGYGNGEWAVVMTKGTDYGEQVYFVDSVWTESETQDFINTYWGASYHITSVFDNTGWPTFGNGQNLAISQHLLRQATPETLSWYETFIKVSAPTEDAFLAVQRIAGMYVVQKQWKRAADVYRAYRSLFPGMERRFDKSIAMLEAGDDTVRIERLGPGVNTTAGEYVPIPTADDSTLYFTGNARPDGVGQEDIYYSTWQGGDWGRARNIREVNTASSEAPTSVSADGNRLTIYSSRGGNNGGDLYYSDRTANGWGPLQKYPEPINTPYWDCDGFITSDGKAMLFASDRPGGIGQFHRKDQYFHGETWGNLDIYVSLKTPTGWSAPINLGPTINTPYADRTPFLHPDGKTLYFSSSGREGFGTLDVFKSTRLRDDSWTEWSEPVNLGKQFNTIGSDWGYKVTTDGSKAYYAAGSEIGRSQTEDIYSITLPKSVRPNPVATIRGVVTDPSGKPLTADIKWEDLEAGKNVGQLKTDPKNGRYIIVLPLGKNYGYFAEKEGYYPVSNNIDLIKIKESVNMTVNIVLVPIKEVAEKGIAVRINNVFFDVDKADLQPESKIELDRLVDLIKQFPNAKIEIAGHTDDQASNAYNLQLSQRRAQAVVDYLVSVGIDRKKLVPKGYGESKPIAGNDTEEGRAMNRRVEFRFLKQ